MNNILKIIEKHNFDDLFNELNKMNEFDRTKIINEIFIINYQESVYKDFLCLLTEKLSKLNDLEKKAFIR